MMWVPAQQLRVYSGSETTLVCVVEAHPEALTYWEFNGQMVTEVDGITMRELSGPPKYKVNICPKSPQVTAMENRTSDVIVIELQLITFYLSRLQ